MPAMGSRLNSEILAQNCAQEAGRDLWEAAKRVRGPLRYFLPRY